MLTGNAKKFEGQVIDAAERFRQRKPKDAPPSEALPQEAGSSSTESSSQAASLVIILAYRWPEIQEEIRVGPIKLDPESYLLFTVIPAPRLQADVRKVLAPYILMGWSIFPFKCEGEKYEPAILQGCGDPYELFRNAAAKLNPEERRVLRTLKFKHVPNPLAR